MQRLIYSYKGGKVGYVYMYVRIYCILYLYLYYLQKVHGACTVHCTRTRIRKI
jgi:hypothetical protein